MVCKLLSDQRDVSRLGVGEPTGQQWLLGRVENHGRRDDGILKLLLQPAINCVGRSARELLSGNDADQRLVVGFFKLAEFSGVNRRLCFSTDPRFQSTRHTTSESASVS